MNPQSKRLDKYSVHKNFGFSMGHETILRSNEPPTYVRTFITYFRNSPTHCSLEITGSMRDKGS